MITRADVVEAAKKLTHAQNRVQALRERNTQGLSMEEWVDAQAEMRIAESEEFKAHRNYHEIFSKWDGVTK